MCFPRGLLLGGGFGLGLDLEAAGDAAVDEDDVALARHLVGPLDVETVDEERAGLDAFARLFLAEELDGHVGDFLRGRGQSGAHQRRDHEHAFQHRAYLISFPAPPRLSK